MSVAAPISAGQLDQRAEIQQKAETPDGGGGVAVVWSKLRDVWCEIRDISGVQKMESMRRDSMISHEIRMRYASDVTTEMRIVHDGVAYNIEAVQHRGQRRKEMLHIIASSGVAT